jgi:putative component of membrane protein insertase Oxa1/YidC/SpoIIIJ protein YidD
MAVTRQSIRVRLKISPRFPPLCSSYYSMAVFAHGCASTLLLNVRGAQVHMMT